MNFSGISNQTALGKLLRFSLRLIPENTVVPVLQGKLRNSRWIIGSSNHGCWLGSYEYGKQNLISGMVKPKTVAFDIGANVGFYTLLFSRLVGEEGQVVAFEPLPRNINYLQRHIALNHLSNVKILPVAVSDSVGVTLFKVEVNSSMGHLSEDGDLKVEQMSIDQYVNEGKLPLPNYLKIDIEGAEYKALLGAEATLRKCHPIIFLATHGRIVHDQCCDFLRTLGYSLDRIKEAGIPRDDEILAT